MDSIVVDKKNNDKTNKFSSAMGDLKGLLDKEGITVNSNKRTLYESTQKQSEANNIDSKIITDHIIHDLISDYEKGSRKAHLSSPEPANSPEPEDSSAPGNNHEVNDNIPTINMELKIDDTPHPTDQQTPKPCDLDDYLSDMEDDELEILEYANSIEELEEKVESIVDSGDIKKYDEIENEFHHNHELYSQKVKEKLQKNLTRHIEQVLDELKINLLTTLDSEIDKLLK